MSDHQKLTREQLDELAGEPLPERAAMSLINANVAAPINAAVALNALSDGSVAYEGPAAGLSAGDARAIYSGRPA